MTQGSPIRFNWDASHTATFALFDSDYYLAMYPDVREAGIDPFDHYLLSGWREFRNPSATFSTGYYLEANPDVMAADMNPLVHYALAGAVEGRSSLPTAAWAAKRTVLSARSARQRSGDWSAVADVGVPLPPDILHELLDTACASAAGGVVVSISHDQYKMSVGGVQNCIAAEETAFLAANWAYVHLCPARPKPMLADVEAPDQTAYVLTLNGLREGVVLLSDFLPALSSAAAIAGRQARLVVHHFMGSSVAAVSDIARVCVAAAPVVWAHDFFHLCSNPFLLRNDSAFCNAPPAGSGACLVCSYGVERRSHLAALTAFFTEFRPVVVSPSTAVRDFWSLHTDLPHASITVAPLAHVRFGAGQSAAAPGGQLRVAHLGATSAHKGWPTFQALLERHTDDPRYRFFRLGLGRTYLPGLTELPVEVGPSSPNAMIDAIRDQAIDVVVNWSSCFETFSYTALEAVAGGAFVVARLDAGNVWPAVAASGSGYGRPLRTEAELFAFFITGEIATLAAAPRPYGELRRANGTADLLLNEAAFA